MMDNEHKAPVTLGEEREEYAVLPVRDLLRILWIRLWLIILVTTLLVGAAVGYGLMQRPTYEASIKILVGQEQQSDSQSSLGSDVQGLQQITQTMVEAVDSRTVAAAVIQQLNLPVTPEQFLENNLTVEQVGATQFIRVDYRDSDPQRAQRVANTVGEVFSQQISDLSASANALTATVWERAAVPSGPVSPNFFVYTAAALVVGLMLGVGLAFLLEYLDDSWRSPEEVEQISGVPTFGIIPAFDIPKAKKNGDR